MTSCVMGSLGVPGWTPVPDECLKNTAFWGKIYGLPFLKKAACGCIIAGAGRRPDGEVELRRAAGRAEDRGERQTG